MKMPGVLLIDNFDSFTYNLVDEFKRLGCDVRVYRNNISMKELDNIISGFRPKLIVISPGPSSPREAGICIPMIRKYKGKVAMLGICLGHQCMIAAFGGVLGRTVPVHGKKSVITHKGSKVFTGLDNPFSAGRYHSLYGKDIPPFFRVTAYAGKIPMAVENSVARMYGLQFHPESILTTDGSRIIQNMLGLIR